MMSTSETRAARGLLRLTDGFAISTGGSNETALITVHDSRGYPPKVTGKRLAPRPESLDARRVWLVDCLFDNSETFMNQLRAWFTQHLPKVETHIIKPKQSWVDDTEMRNKIASEGDAAILGVGL